MQFENRVPDETVNYSRAHPLAEFGWLVVAALGLTLALAAVVAFFGGEIAARLPFQTENNFAARITRHWEDRPRDAQAEAARAALRTIATRLAAVMDLPEGMQLQVHYSPAPVINAFATLGGNVVFHRGLLMRFESEDAVAAVLAHEIAHARLRHPAASLGRGIATGLTLSLLSAGLGESVAGGAMQMAATLPLLKYSREQESAADREAVVALARVYGHAGGAHDALGTLGRIRPDGGDAAFLRTHPVSAERVAAVERIARERGYALDRPRTPLPPALAALKDKSAGAKADGE
jgi:predicted Zn-dependent protease